MVREKERRTVKQLLVSPLSPFQIMFPKAIAMTLVILVGMSLSLFALLGPMFQVPMRGSLPLFYFVTTLYVFVNAGLGLLSLLIMAPILLLSGLWTPPEAMPAWLRLATLASPLRHYIDASYGILLKGAGLDLLWDSVLAMGVLGALILALGIGRFRRQFT